MKKPKGTEEFHARLSIQKSEREIPETIVSRKVPKSTAKQYRRDKEIIRRGMASFVEVGEALARVRDSQSFKEEYGSFEEFCNAEFGFAPQYGNRLIASAELVKALPAPIRKEITTETQAKALGKVPKAERVKVLKKAKQSGKVTARSIEDAAFEEVKKPTVESAFIDSLPENLRANREHAIAEAVEAERLIGLLIEMAEHAKKVDDLAYGEIDLKTLLTQLNRIRAILALLYRENLCPKCKGSGEHCKHCRMFGLVSDKKR